MKYLKFFLPCMILCFLLCACSHSDTSAQTRNDLTSDHFNGLSSNMRRSDVEDLLGQGDGALGQNESYAMYSLVDGTTAILRYTGDELQSAYIRGKDNIERALFDNYRDGSNQIDDGTTSESDLSSDNSNATSDESNNNESNTTESTNNGTESFTESESYMESESGF